MASPQQYSTRYERDYSKCDICGVDLPVDRLHVMVNNGMIIKNIYCCRKHRYVEVDFKGELMIQDRSDRELEHLSSQFRQGMLKHGWE